MLPARPAAAACSFCEASSPGRKMVVRLGAPLCEACVVFCSGIVSGGQDAPKPPPPADGFDLSCSLCKKPWREVSRLVIGPRIYVCDECVRFCSEGLSRTAEPKATASPGPDLVRVRSGIEYLLLRSAPAGKRWQAIRFDQRAGEVFGSLGGEPERSITKTQPSLVAAMIEHLMSYSDASSTFRIQISPAEQRAFHVRLDRSAAGSSAIVTPEK